MMLAMHHGILRVLMAFLFLFMSVSSWGHSLPGSELVLSSTNKAPLSLEITFSQEDLLIAEPRLKRFGTLTSEGQVLNSDVQVALSQYFTQHLQLRQGQTPLPMTLVQAKLKTAYNHHVGQFTQWYLRYEVGVERRPILPLMLTYDAILHEIRSHKVSVYWQNPNGDKIKLVRFGYRLQDGKPKSYLLSAER